MMGRLSQDSMECLLGQAAGKMEGRPDPRGFNIDPLHNQASGCWSFCGILDGPKKYTGTHTLVPFSRGCKPSRLLHCPGCLFRVDDRTIVIWTLVR